MRKTFALLLLDHVQGFLNLHPFYFNDILFASERYYINFILLINIKQLIFEKDFIVERDAVECLFMTNIQF